MPQIIDKSPYADTLKRIALSPSNGGDVDFGGVPNTGGQGGMYAPGQDLPGYTVDFSKGEGAPPTVTSQGGFVPPANAAQVAPTTAPPAPTIAPTPTVGTGMLNPTSEVASIRSGYMPGFAAQTPQGKQAAYEIGQSGAHPVTDARVAQYSAEAAARAPAAQAILGAQPKATGQVKSLADVNAHRVAAGMKPLLTDKELSQKQLDAHQQIAQRAQARQQANQRTDPQDVNTQISYGRQAAAGDVKNAAAMGKQAIEQARIDETHRHNLAVEGKGGRADRNAEGSVAEWNTLAPRETMPYIDPTTKKPALDQNGKPVYVYKPENDQQRMERLQRGREAYKSLHQSLPKIASDEDFDKLPSGAHFIDPEGNRRVKP